MGYRFEQAIARVDRRTNTVELRPGIGIAHVLDAPQPTTLEAGGWHKSTDWWSDLLGHYELFESEGRGNEPMLHPDQR